MAYGNRLTRTAYYKSPVWMQNVLCTLYGYRHKRLWQGRYFWRHYTTLQDNQWKSLDELLDIQWRRLKDLLDHAYQNVPYYRQQWQRLGITPKDIRSQEDLRYLPVLEKETLREGGRLFLSRAFNFRKLIETHTSGTTGKPLTVWVSREAYEREYSFRWHHYSWSGVAFGARRAYISGHPVVEADRNAPPFSRVNYAENSLLFSSQHLSEGNLHFYVNELAAFRPEFIEGYPSSIYLLARYIKARGICSIKPRAVYVTSETLFDFQRSAIEDAFGCKVFNWYGNTERAGNITECTHGSLHIQLEHAVVEILDPIGRSAAPGTEGEMVVTGLGNFAFPLIRYRIGDVAVPRKGKCSCGRSSPLVEQIVGRVEDYVVAPDGRYFGRLDHIFKDTKHVREAQIVQDEINHLLLRIVPGSGFSEDDKVHILRAARERLGSVFQLDIELVNAIRRDASGKFRFVVNNVSSRLNRRA